MKRSLFIVILLFNLGLAHQSVAGIRLPAIIGNHMVLQQKTTTRIWGWSEPNEKIVVSPGWDTVTYQTRAGSNAKWLVEIATPAAGGPFTIKIKGNDSLVIEDVLIGEVWDCSGQSNMEMSYSWGIKKYTADVDSATNTQIRFFHIPRLTSEYPQDDTRGKWVVCNPVDMKRFSLVGYFFGKRIQETLGIPVGLINASWGGTPAESWTPADTIRANPILEKANTKLEPNPGWPILPGYTFNAMIHPITNYAIAGVLWYQGEANVTNPDTYYELLTTMIRTWREAWRRDFPFYLVQIAPYAGYGNNLNGARLREAQTRVANDHLNGMVVIHDLVPDINDIHPKDKKEVGWRLANLALAETYSRKDSAYLFPRYMEMKIDRNKVTIYFDHADKGLISKSGSPTGFYLAGTDKVFWPATAKIKGNTVIVSAKEVPTPVALRFGFTNWSMPDLFSKEGLPVNLFRTDDWNDVMTVIPKSP